MSDYSKGKIYTIRCKTDTSLIYVGSTIQSLARRWGGHKSKSLRYPNYFLYQTINSDWHDWYIKLYELFPCNCKEELLKKEGELIRLIGTLNTHITGRSKKEYSKEWRENNKEKIKNYDKEYREDNKEKIKDYKKEYYEVNKEKINEKFNCDCGGCYAFRNKARHLKTKKHINYLSTLQS